MERGIVDETSFSDKENQEPSTLPEMTSQPISPEMPSPSSSSSSEMSSSPSSSSSSDEENLTNAPKRKRLTCPRTRLDKNVKLIGEVACGAMILGYEFFIDLSLLKLYVKTLPVSHAQPLF